MHNEISSPINSQEFNRQPESPNKSDEKIIEIKPKKFASGLEAAKEGHHKFSELIKEADTRSLVEYLRKEKVKIKDLKLLPLAWRQHFESKDFLNQSYTWRNPKLYFVVSKRVTEVVLAELLKRLGDGPPITN